MTLNRKCNRCGNKVPVQRYRVWFDEATGTYVHSKTCPRCMWELDQDVEQETESDDSV